MLFDIGWPELMLIGVVALVVIGPKDLPRAMRVAGFWVRKARTLSREFQSSIDQMIREAELDEVRDELKKATEFDIEKEFHNTVDPTGSLAGNQDESIRPPNLPDYFEPPEVVEPEAAEPLPALSAPSETALADPASAGQSPPEPSIIQPPGPREHSSAAVSAPEPEPTPAPPKP